MRSPLRSSRASTGTSRARARFGTWWALGLGTTVLGGLAAGCGARDIGRYGTDDTTTTSTSTGTGGAGGEVGGAGGTGAVGAFGGTGPGGTGGSVGGGGAGGTGAMGGTGGTGAMGGTGGTGGTGGILEDCLNWVDDDGDGDIDCADTECVAGYRCAAPTPPGGWSGPVVAWEGPALSLVPSCFNSNGFTQVKATGKDGLSFSPAICPTCSCSTPQGVACQVGKAGFYSNGTCTGGGGTLTVAGGICQAFITSSIDPTGVRWEEAPPGGGACLPSPDGPVTVPPLVWTDQLKACGDPPTGGGCGAGVCVPRPNAPFYDTVCIYRDGDHSCPGGPYTDKLLYYQDVSDTRDCTGCECGAPVGTSCVGTMKLYTDTNCMVDEVVLTSVGQCAPLQPDPTPPPPPYMSLRSVEYVGSPGGTGTCASIPGTTTGSASETNPVTVCCVP